MNRNFLMLCAVLAFMVLPVHAQLANVSVSVAGGVNDSSLKEAIEKNTSQLLTLFNNTVIEGKTKLDFPKEQTFCTEEGKKEVNELWKKSSAMMCQVSMIDENVSTIKAGGFQKYQIRNIPVIMMAADENDQDQELVINFNNKGQIDEILVALESNRYQEIIREGVEPEDFARRQIILDFVEQFRTAYNRKDLNYISSVFSDNALIITGKVLKSVKQSDNMINQLGKEEIEYQTKSKSEYIANLKSCFKKNAYINVEFEDAIVRRHAKKGDVYGVNLKQHWNSSTYSDVGYLFLMIDFSDEDQPYIQVRTWQPEEFIAKYNAEKFTLDSFNL